MPKRSFLAVALALAFAVGAPALAAPQRCAHILAGVVDNVVIADPGLALPGVDCSNPAAQVGWSFAGGVYSPPAAAAPTYQTTGLTFLQFMALFSPAEQAAIVTSTDTQTRIFIMMATGAGALDLTNPEVVSGVEYLALLGLIAAGRARTILSGAPPA